MKAVKTYNQNDNASSGGKEATSQVLAIVQREAEKQSKSARTVHRRSRWNNEQTIQLIGARSINNHYYPENRRP